MVAVSDVSGAIYDPRGLDVPRVLAYYSETGQVRGFPDTKLLDNQQLLGLPVDVLLPAAMEGQITADNASEIHARIIVEGANGPTTPEADEILMQRGTLVVPDILANAVESPFQAEGSRTGTAISGKKRRSMSDSKRKWSPHSTLFGTPGNGLKSTPALPLISWRSIASSRRGTSAGCTRSGTILALDRPRECPHATVPWRAKWW